MKRLILLFLLSANCNAATWECISASLGCHTWRMAVPNGWLISGTNHGEGFAMTFVPDTGHTWQ